MADLHYSGNFPLWRMSYYMVGIMRDMFEEFGTSFQALFNVKKGNEIPYIDYERWAFFIGDMTTAIIVKRNMQPMKTESDLIFLIKKIFRLFRSLEA